MRHAVLQWGETPYAIGKLDHVFLAIQSYSGIIFELFRLFLLVLLFIVSVFLERRYYLQSSYWDAEPEAKKCGFSGFCRRETGYLFSWRFPLGACSPVLRGGPIMLIPLNPTLKPWADITSQGVLSGLINGMGAYIRGGGGIQPECLKCLGTTRHIRKRIKANIKLLLPCCPIRILMLVKTRKKRRTYTLHGLISGEAYIRNKIFVSK